MQAGGAYLQNLLYENIVSRLPKTTRKNVKIQLGSHYSSETLVIAAALPAINAFFEPETSTI